VAELADALDSKTSVARLLRPAHRYSSEYKAYLARKTEKARACSQLFILAHGQVTDKLKRIALALLACLLACSLASGQESHRAFRVPDTPKPNRTIFMAGVSLLAASKTADAISTRQLLDRGGWENNPIFGRHPSPAKQAGINLAFFAGESALFYLTERNHHAWVRWTGRAFLAHAITEHSHAAACNAGINTHAPVIRNCSPFVAF